MRLSPQSAAAPPVRMGLTNFLVGKYLHENNLHSCKKQYSTAAAKMQILYFSASISLLAKS